MDINWLKKKKLDFLIDIDFSPKILVVYVSFFNC